MGKILRVESNVLQFKKRAVTEAFGPYSYVVMLPEEVRERAHSDDIPLSFEGQAYDSQQRAKRDAADRALDVLSTYRFTPEPKKLLARELKGSWSQKPSRDVWVEIVELLDGKFMAKLHVRIPKLKLWKDVASEIFDNRQSAVMNAAQKALSELTPKRAATAATA